MMQSWKAVLLGLVSLAIFGVYIRQETVDNLVEDDRSKSASTEWLEATKPDFLLERESRYQDHIVLQNHKHTRELLADVHGEYASHLEKKRERREKTKNVIDEIWQFQLKQQKKEKLHKLQQNTKVSHTTGAPSKNKNQQDRQQKYQKQQNQQEQQQRGIDGKKYPLCNLQLVETIPSILIDKNYTDPLPVEHMSTFKAWLHLIDNTKHELAFLSQWAVQGYGKDKELYKHLVNGINSNGIDLKIAFNNHGGFDMHSNFTPEALKKMQKKHGQVEYAMPLIEGKITPGHKGNIIHSKLFISDKNSFYVGSANFGSRSTTRTKELGIMGTKCPLMAEDVHKQWQLYWFLDGKDKIPTKFPYQMSTKINVETPLEVFNSLDNTAYKIFLGASPVPLCATGRSDDLAAILYVIDSAKDHIHIAVGEYIPMVIFKKPKQEWTPIQDSLNKAMARGVKVKFLVNDHATHHQLMFDELNKLMSVVNTAKRLDTLEVRMFTSKIDFKRFHGSHNKFMVTEKAAFIGTSNWTGDYFSDTAGVSFVFEPIGTRKKKPSKQKFNLLQQLEQVFQRDWNSKLTIPIKTYN